MRFRFPWQRKDEEEYFPMEKPRRPRETLKQAAEKVLIKELKKLAVDPDAVRMPGTLYDELVEQAEEASGEEEEE